MKIDYEAAGQAIWNHIQGDGSVTWAREDKTIKKQYVEWGYAAVDAALPDDDLWVIDMNKIRESLPNNDLAQRWVDVLVKDGVLVKMERNSDVG